MAHQWFVVRNGKEQGPFTSQQLKSFADAGKLHREDQVRREDMKSPAAAHMVKGLFPEPQLQLEDPPPPPKKPLLDTGPTLGERARAEAKLEASTLQYYGSPVVTHEAQPMNPLLFTALIGALAGVFAALCFGGFWGMVLTGAFIGATGNYRVASRPGLLFFGTTIILFAMAWFGFLGKSAYDQGYDIGYAESRAAVQASAEIGDSPANKKYKKVSEYAQAQYDKKSDNTEWLRGYRNGLQAGSER